MILGFISISLLGVWTLLLALIHSIIPIRGSIYRKQPAKPQQKSQSGSAFRELWNEFFYGN